MSLLKVKKIEFKSALNDHTVLRKNFNSDGSLKSILSFDGSNFHETTFEDKRVKHEQTWNNNKDDDGILTDYNLSLIHI